MSAGAVIRPAIVGEQSECTLHDEREHSADRISINIRCYLNGSMRGRRKGCYIQWRSNPHMHLRPLRYYGWPHARKAASAARVGVGSGRAWQRNGEDLNSLGVRAGCLHIFWASGLSARIRPQKTYHNFSPIAWLSGKCPYAPARFVDDQFSGKGKYANHLLQASLNCGGVQYVRNWKAHQQPLDEHRMTHGCPVSHLADHSRSPFHRHQAPNVAKRHPGPPGRESPRLRQARRRLN